MDQFVSLAEQRVNDPHHRRGSSKYQDTLNYFELNIVNVSKMGISKFVPKIAEMSLMRK